jgi:hypothetical protein
MQRTRPLMAANRTKFGMGNNTKAWNISGFHEIIQNLNVQCLAITGGGKEGWLHVAKHIRRDMEVNQPYIPIDKGNLIATWQASPLTEGTKHGVRMGFSANYALWVHEMLGDVKWSRPGSGPKFLQKAIERNHEQILSILAEKMRVK